MPVSMASLQAFVDIGLSEVPAELRPVARAVLDAAEAGRLDSLTGEAAAAAVVMSTAEAGEALLEAHVSRDPVEALAVALGVCRLHLRFAMVHGKLARVLERPTRKPSSTLPQPAFWLKLRRALDAAPPLRPRARALAEAADLSDLRLRGAVAFVVPDAPLWNDAHLAEVRKALPALDPVEAGLYLLGVLRHQPWAAASATWPPPVRALRSLPEDVLETALALAGDHRALERLARKREVAEAAADLAPLLDAPLEDGHLTVLARVVPDATAIACAAERLTRLGEIEAPVVRALVTGWVLGAPGAADEASARSDAVAATVAALRRAALVHLPATRSLATPWDGARAKRDRREPPPFLAAPPRGQWAARWAPPPASLDVAALDEVRARLASNALVFVPAGAPREAYELVFEAWKAGRAPDEYTFAPVLEALGPSTLPAAAQWTRRNPNILPTISFIDDGLLAPAWALALSSRRRPLQEAARTWLDAHPALGAYGVLTLLFSADAAEQQAGRHALRWFEPRHRDVLAAACAALDDGQRAWLDEVRTEAPSLPARAPALPSFLQPAALPGVASRDGAARLDAAGVKGLLALAKASTLDDAEPLLRAAAGFDPSSLANFAGAVFTAWLSAGAPPKERWALQLLAHFPDDTWARVLGGLSQAWALSGFSARAQDAVEVLSRMPSRVALLEVHRLSTKIRSYALRAKARLAFQDAAVRLGLSPEALEDRLVPDFGLVHGRTLFDDIEVDLDEALKPVLRRHGTKVKALPATASAEAEACWAAVKKGARQLKESAQRLERLMSEGRTLPASHFTEVWLMHPLLSRIAERVAWAAFADGQRAGVFLTHPLRTVDGRAFVLDVSMTVRPVHPLELSIAEREALASQLGAPPFPQLSRELYQPADLRAVLREHEGVTVTSTALIALERTGWTRGPHVGGTYVTVERRGPLWRVELEFEPGVYLGDPGLNPQQRITGVRVEGEAAMTPVAKSELLRQLHFLAPQR
jgi:hypothetical protein